MEESIFAAAVTNCRVGRATAVLQCTAAITICRETAMDGRGVQYIQYRVCSAVQYWVHVQCSTGCAVLQYRN